MLNKQELTNFTIYIMKKEIHPKYKKIVAHCACGAEYSVGSTAKEIHLGICAACHPYFTGKQKLIDSAGRVEKFKKRFEKKQK